MSDIKPGDFTQHLIDTTVNEGWFGFGKPKLVSVADLALTFTTETGLSMTDETLDAITKFTKTTDRNAKVLTPEHVAKLKPTFAREYINIFLNSIETLTDAEFNDLRMAIANTLGVP